MEDDKIEYDYNYSLTKEEVKKMDEWITKHSKKYHKKGYPYQGAISISRYVVQFEAFSIGVSADCICKECNKCYEKEKDTKKREKLYKQSRYEIRSFD